MYRALSCPQYNTYMYNSPRYCISLTTVGIWSLNTTVTIITCLGFDVFYGDNDIA